MSGDSWGRCVRTYQTEWKKKFCGLFDAIKGRAFQSSTKKKGYVAKTAPTPRKLLKKVEEKTENMKNVQEI